MLHHFMEKGPWFRAKTYGYGAGLPFRWQGWVLLLSHIALIAGLTLGLGDDSRWMIPAVLVAAFAPLPIYAAKTEGGWKWRWGG
ncbi:MAG: hypothetical protein IPG54_09180 [Sphingomonadales bacterium]|jgi:hypothetical protein|nr:hypothetical protein [Sphingomonadales bacterium]MBK9005010.1 hypothetical protein [Sphingomonadales bacterium]MBK9267257.1 hypothetical protein [Sphingomonadales bacterium]MBP6433585.1 hypothetical protein [Sphingorhabdus sp.]